VLRRTRRSAALAAACAALLLPALAACSDDSGEGADSGSDSAPTGTLDGVTIEGEVGEELTVEWGEELAVPEETEVVTLVEGDGEEIEEGDLVGAFLYVGDGATQQDAYSDFARGAAQAIPNDERAGEFFPGLMDGATYGSRVAALTTADELFGGSAEGNALGIATDAPVVVVMDLVDERVTSPTPSSEEPEQADPEAQPEVVVEGGDPVALDFSGVEEPELDTPVQVLVLEEGDGPEVTSEDTVTVDYLGSVYDADEPFDGSYSRGEPLVSPLSGLIPGWTIGLTGVPVGSRVLLQIPPAFGYGEQGSGAAIPGNATLWFVIDVIEADTPA